MKVAIEVPKPGSVEAVRIGCCCPIIDNHYGAGYKTLTGIRHFVHEDCPLHAKGERPTTLIVPGSAHPCPGYPLR